jgi:hypothetical protein
MISSVSMLCCWLQQQSLTGTIQVAGPALHTPACLFVFRPFPLLSPGKLFHSGLPHKSINPIEMAMDAVREMQKRFYEDFGPHPLEAK